jgi:hypothetical protein
MRGVFRLSILVAPVAGILAMAQGPPSTEQMLVLGSLAGFQARSHVPMGIELRPSGAVIAPDAPPESRIRALPLTPPRLAGGDPRAVPSSSVIRRALDEFVAANPGYAWATSGLLVHVQPSRAVEDAADWLNAPVASFALSGAAVRDALVALRRLFDPGYDGSRVVAGRMPPMQASAASQPRERMEQAQDRRFDVSLQGVRVREVLDAIVLAHGEASWLVSFDGPAPVADRARIEVVFWQGSSAIAYAGVPPLRPAPVPGNTGSQRLVMLPLTRTSLQSTITRITSAAGYPVGFRAGPECRTAGGARPAQFLDLEALSVREAVDLALSQCPGYERRSFGDIVNIGPAGRFGKDGVLDSRKARFTVTAMPFNETMIELARMIRGSGPAPGRPLSRVPTTIDSERAMAIMVDRTRPVTVDLEKATLREALNAVVAAHGAAWWAVDGPSAQGLVRLTLGGASWSQSWEGSQ